MKEIQRKYVKSQSTEKAQNLKGILLSTGLLCTWKILESAVNYLFIDFRELIKEYLILPVHLVCLILL